MNQRAIGRIAIAAVVLAGTAWALLARDQFTDWTFWPDRVSTF
jgi:hypothetical protein